MATGRREDPGQGSEVIGRITIGQGGKEVGAEERLSILEGLTRGEVTINLRNGRWKM